MSNTSAREEINVDMNDQLEAIIRDVGEESFNRAHVYDNLCSGKEEPLYPRCTNFTRLSAVLRFFNLKARNGWTDKSFTELLELLKKMLLEGNTLSNRNYEAKKLLCPMDMEYRKIHACHNDYLLYRNEFEELTKCPRCGLSCYKMKDGDSIYDESSKRPPAKVLWYLPIVPRWHADERKRDGQLRHPADSLKWKKINDLYPEFGSEPRNLRLGLSTDGMNPYGNLSSNHSLWPVLLVIYNLPPWICMKRIYIMLSMMISGPKQPGNNIDVYLSPLIEDLRMLWEGVDVFDGYSREYFMMRAMLFCTINDFPAYGNLCGYSVKGHKACPICEEGTCYQQLKHGRKVVYVGHQKFLKSNHPYRKLRKSFNGDQEHEISQKALTGEQVYQRVKDINVIFGKNQKQTSEKNIWKKKSVLFDLPYWSSLDVRHCLDVMHVEKNVCDSVIGTLLNIQGKTKDDLNSRLDMVDMEKNVCDSVIGTLLNIPGKTKDGLNSRLDMVDMGIRQQLAPQSTGKRTYLPPACHTLSKKEKRCFCECLRGIKVPHGYSSNVKSLVSMKDLKLVGLKSHDCHILMQQLLPVALRGILPKKVREVLTRLCLFFNAICSKFIDPQKLNELENEAVIILCQLEMYFPPSFFDIMVHLIVHLVREIKLCGPVYLRWMYPFECYMKILKGYVNNPHRPEASIVERYIAEEAIEFCSEYMTKAEAIGIPRSRHEGTCVGNGIRGLKLKSMGREEVLQAHLYILNNTDEVQPYLSTHKSIVKENYPKMNEKWLLNKHNKTFLKWFKETILTNNTTSDTLKWLANGPHFDVITWTGYNINNFTFYTKSQDDRSTMQNSGVMVVAESMHFSSSKDKNPVTASIPYFGTIEEICDVDFIKFKVHVFKCKLIDINNGVKIDKFGFTMVDLEKVAYKDEPFIMASQAKQVFYVSDPSNKKWLVVLQGKSFHGPNESLDSTLDVFDTPPFSQRILTFVEETIVDDEYATRDDHQEGIWENIQT
uniref:Uncharacterized protein LOC101504571 n=1 Tax=Cicer arietinum TaxID=3827 RepID=A0A1S2XQI8_CICAR|nr:uncharacterized protein LOC101504571 [Cicer arietinum]